MQAASEIITQGIPEPLWKFASEASGISIDAFRMLPGRDVPEPARQLLVHGRDMTSTLAEFHGSKLRVDLLQQRQLDQTYLREVYLRTQTNNQVVEYGVIAIALEQFTTPQCEVIRAGRTPLGAILHQFQIAFESSPLGFFSVASTALANARFQAFRGSLCFGRFNRLTKPGGAPLAWIMEILPPAKAR